MILALPIPIVWRLTLELRQKIILSVVFTLGSMYVFALPFQTSLSLSNKTDMFTQQLLCHQFRTSPQRRNLDPRRRQRYNLHPPTHRSLVVRLLPSFPLNLT
jgi:hypothetical protein